MVNLRSLQLDWDWDHTLPEMHLLFANMHHLERIHLTAHGYCDLEKQNLVLNTLAKNNKSLTRIFVYGLHFNEEVMREFAKLKNLVHFASRERSTMTIDTLLILLRGNSRNSIRTVIVSFPVEVMQQLEDEIRVIAGEREQSYERVSKSEFVIKCIL
jgi:hypothetical protein